MVICTGLLFADFSALSGHLVLLAATAAGAVATTERPVAASTAATLDPAQRFQLDERIVTPVVCRRTPCRHSMADGGRPTASSLDRSGCEPAHELLLEEQEEDH